MKGLEADNDDGKSIPFSTRIPYSFIFLAGGTLLFGGMGFNSTLYKATESTTTTACFASAERAENLATDAIRITTDTNRTVTSTALAVESLRAEIVARTGDRYTKTEADEIHTRNNREHEILRQVDASQDRQIMQIDRDIEALRR